MSLKIESSERGRVDQQDQLSNKPEKNIRPSDAYRGSIRLLKGLSDLGINSVQPGQLQVFKSLKTEDVVGLIDEVTSNNSNNTDEQKPTTDISSRIRRVLGHISIDVPHSVLFFPFSNSELIVDHSTKWTSHSTSTLEAHMDFAGQPFRLVMHKEPKGPSPYELSLVMPTHIPQKKEISLDQLPLTFKTVGFTYDIANNPQHRELLSSMSKKRVPAEFIDNNIRRRSSVRGHESPEGISTTVDLYLQKPNDQNFLKCYEVELFSKDGLKNPENTTEAAPEAIWQAKENHYCMTEGKSYPLVPIELGKISKLSMVISYYGYTPQIMFDLLGDLPLSIDGTNQWYARGYLGDGNDGNVELLFKPEWGENNARLVYRKNSSKRISAKEIHSAVDAMNGLKNAVAERLAA